MNCVSVICRRPNDIWVEFLSKFTNYDVFIVIDDNSIDYKEKYKEYTKVNIVQIDNEECKEAGFTGMCLVDPNIKKEVVAWDKALYYFSTINTNYENIWFIEDDVFFYNEETLMEIDSNNQGVDLISTSYKKRFSFRKNMWLWDKINIKFNLPYYQAMSCAVRASKLLLSKIKEYATEYKELFYLEALFPTICMRNDLKCNISNKLKNIVYKREYTINDINKNELYHPMKNINDHIVLRNHLDKRFL